MKCSIFSQSTILQQLYVYAIDKISAGCVASAEVREVQCPGDAGNTQRAQQSPVRVPSEGGLTPYAQQHHEDKSTPLTLQLYVGAYLVLVIELARGLSTCLFHYNRGSGGVEAVRRFVRCALTAPPSILQACTDSSGPYSAGMRQPIIPALARQPTLRRALPH